MTLHLEKSWNSVLEDELQSLYMQNLMKFLEEEYEKELVYPEPNSIFNAFNQTSFNDVKVVILGQDPYHQPGQAHGLAFSVPKGIKIPPSLRNIYKELAQDISEFQIPFHGDLSVWAEQGVLLLNSTLTVRANQAGSHQKKGWEEFTEAVIRRLSELKSNLVFILWGNFAREKAVLIDQSKHLILQSPHPSPLSAHQGFFGNRHFSKTNDFLIKHQIKAIHWQLPIDLFASPQVQ